MIHSNKGTNLYLLLNAGPRPPRGRDKHPNRDITYSFPLCLTPLVEAVRAASPSPVVQRRKRGIGKE